MTRKAMDHAEWQRFKESAKELARLLTFEGRIEELESICRQTLGARPNRPIDVPPEEHSQAWYAERILLFIRMARRNLKQGHASHAAAEAVTIGALAAEAAARLRWPDVKQWLNRIDNESKENWLVGEVISKVALAGQITELFSAKRFGLDMEVEFKDNDGKPTGKKLYLQLKSGDSHLQRRDDGAEIFRIKKKDHADYWMSQAFPVLLVIGNSRGEVRWMEISDYLKRERGDGEKRLRHIVFDGEPFDIESVLRWRERILIQHGSIQAEADRPTHALKRTPDGAA